MGLGYAKAHCTELAVRETCIWHTSDMTSTFFSGASYKSFLTSSVIQGTKEVVLGIVFELIITWELTVTSEVLDTGV